MIYMLKNKILWKGGMQKILKKQAHLNKVLKALLNTNQLIGKESDPACLIQKACEEILTAGKRGADLVNQISEMAETIRKVLDDVIG